MPTTKQAKYGLDPWSGIRDPESMPYQMKRGIASLIWRENGGYKKAYAARTTALQFIKAYKIIGASLVEGGYLWAPNGRQGLLDPTAKGEERARKLQKSSGKKAIEKMKRAERALEYLDEVLVKLKRDLDAGVIKETLG